MNDINEIYKSFMAELQEDYVGFWEFKGRWKEGASEAEIKQNVLILSEMLLKQGIKVGEFQNDGDIHFVPWEGDIASHLARIDREWDRVGGNPNISDIGWFALLDD